MTICEGAHEDCPHCNENSENDDGDNRKSLICIGLLADNDTEYNSDNDESSNREEEVEEPQIGEVQIGEPEIEKNKTEKSQPGCESNSGSSSQSEEDPDQEETHSIGTNFTYDEIDPATGNITRHCPNARPLHEMLWRGREFLREDNQNTYIQTPESCKASVKVWPPSIAYVRDEFINFNLCKKAVKKDGYAIKCINRNLLTPEEYYKLAMVAVTNNGFCFSEVPGDIQTQELCNAAVESSCWALPYCYRNFRTPELCLSAVSRNGETLKHVPEELITYDMCLAAINSGYECMEFIPKEHITPELCKAAVEASGRNIQHIPKEYITSEIGLIAVKTKAKNQVYSMAGNNLRFIPEEHITKEIILEAMKTYIHAYSDIPKELLTDEMNEAILEVSPICITRMQPTARLIIKALQSDIRIIQFIKKRHIDKEVAKYILLLPTAHEEFDESSLDHLKALVNDTEESSMSAQASN